MQSTKPKQDQKKERPQAKVERDKQKNLNRVSELAQQTINDMLYRER